MTENAMNVQQDQRFMEAMPLRSKRALANSAAVLG